MAVWGEIQYAVTGDTYPVGCLPGVTLMYGLDSFEGNPDLDNPKYKWVAHALRFEFFLAPNWECMTSIVGWRNF